jgi:hypothetical protein
MHSQIRQVYLFTAVAVALVIVLGGMALAQSNNPQVGTWKLNVAKSKYTAGPASKSGTTKIETAGTGVKYIVDQVGADGAKLHWEFTAQYDGKDYPVAGNPNADMVALTRSDPNHVKLVNKIGGKVTTTQTSVVSSDGKTRTVTTTGTNSRGQKINTVAIYERQ